VNRAELAIELVRTVGSTAAGSTASVAARTPDDVEYIDRWCRANGSSVLAVHPDAVEIYRGSLSDVSAVIPPERMPGYRLWIYTNFHCNLACAYCCAESSPRAQPKLIDVGMISKLVQQAVAVGTREIYLTGGEPFLHPDIAEIVTSCVSVAPTVLLTNGMLFSGARKAALDLMPRAEFMLQISVDSPTAEVHDAQRGTGSWAKAIAGVRVARDLGFRVRLASTISAGSPHEETALADLCAELGLAASDTIVRRVAAEGFANDGIVITRESVLPEVCVTADGVFWHPVAITNPTMRVTQSVFPLHDAVSAIREEFLDFRRRGNVLAASFPCA
jgi:MoaA/NifB/PqqE/SkfB family radical SAM enzyme